MFPYNVYNLSNRSKAESESGFASTTFTALLPWNGKWSPGVKVQLAETKHAVTHLHLHIYKQFIRLYSLTAVCSLFKVITSKSVRKRVSENMERNIVGAGKTSLLSVTQHQPVVWPNFLDHVYWDKWFTGERRLFLWRLLSCLSSFVWPSGLYQLSWSSLTLLCQNMSHCLSLIWKRRFCRDSDSIPKVGGLGENRGSVKRERPCVRGVGGRLKAGRCARAPRPAGRDGLGQCGTTVQ